MPVDVFLANGKPTIRSASVTRLLFDVLAKAHEPIRAGEVIRRMATRFEPTPREASTNPSGSVRWEVHARYMSSWAKQIGWLEKETGRWALTPAGREAIDRFPGDALERELNRRWEAQRRSEPTAPGERGVLAQALDLLGPGSWTTYGDLAQLTGMANQGISTAMRSLQHEAAHRVLQADGTVSLGFQWFDPARTESPQDVLAAEGLEFNSEGHAEHASRMTVEEFRELIPVESPAARGWLVRGNNVTGVDLVPTWLSKGFCSLAAAQTRSLDLPMTRADIAAMVEEQYAQKSYSARGDTITEYDTFINRMRVGDVVATNSNGVLYLGRITGDASTTASDGDRSNLRRPVDWLNAGSPIDYGELPSRLAARLSSQHTIVDLTSEMALLEEALTPTGPVVQPGTPEEPTPPKKLTRDLFPHATNELAETNLVSREWLQELIDLLWDRRQLIFYGPPGTGKTYLARAVAQHLTAPENVKLVQFHPAYSYEDFFEGYRPAKPVEGSTTVGFELTPGPFRRLVDAARDNPATPFILIIDEINRANLAKVFGELYFLLEYREEAIDLLYASGDDQGFTLPDNVFLIGTMNTADRSIALVDSAMRRRFAFLPLHPSEEPTAGLLERWLAREGHPPAVAQVLHRLNGLIDDPDMKIGPSYFMRRPEVHRNGGLGRVWRTAILPLLEEHHYGEGIDVAKRYDLTALLRGADRGDDGPPRAAGTAVPPTRPVPQDEPPDASTGE